MHTPTRLLILDYLRKQHAGSVSELSRSLKMTGANIRHHLAVLEENDLIELISQRREGRGRPGNVYGLSRQVLGDGLDKLAGAMIQVWVRTAPENMREAGLRNMAVWLADETNLKGNILIPKRLARTVDRLNELHYQSRWEAGLKGPVIILDHCPYAAIIDMNPELCSMDSFLLEHLTGLSVEQTHKLHTSTKGYPYCAFSVAADN
jgi:predicted ArsR family transcriptional regulator